MIYQVFPDIYDIEVLKDIQYGQKAGGVCRVQMLRGSARGTGGLSLEKRKSGETFLISTTM